MSSPSKRRQTDLMKLMINDYQVEMVNDEMKEFSVIFKGPTESSYFGGFWKVNVELPNAYPYSSPSVAFANKIYHPNIDFERGAVCVNLLNHEWSPMTDLVHVFEFFLPQLLKEPNADDPMNQEAADLMLHNPRAYDKKVKEYCQRFAKPEDVGVDPKQESSDGEPSEDDYSSGDMAGPADA